MVAQNRRNVKTVFIFYLRLVWVKWSSWHNFSCASWRTHQHGRTFFRLHQWPQHSTRWGKITELQNQEWNNFLLNPRKPWHDTNKIVVIIWQVLTSLALIHVNNWQIIRIQLLEPNEKYTPRITIMSSTQSAWFTTGIQCSLNNKKRVYSKITQSYWAGDWKRQSKPCKS